MCGRGGLGRLRILQPFAALCHGTGGRPLARAIANDGPGRIGLFVRPTDDEIRAVLDHVPLDGLQIYDDASRAAAIRDRFALPVWLAAGIGSTVDLPASCAVDGLVIESRAPKGSDRPGAMPMPLTGP